MILIQTIYRSHRKRKPLILENTIEPLQVDKKSSEFVESKKNFFIVLAYLMLYFIFRKFRIWPLLGIRQDLVEHLFLTYLHPKIHKPKDRGPIFHPTSNLGPLKRKYFHPVSSRQ